MAVLGFSGIYRLFFAAFRIPGQLQYCPFGPPWRLSFRGRFLSLFLQQFIIIYRDFQPPEYRITEMVQATQKHRFKNKLSGNVFDYDINASSTYGPFINVAGQDNINTVSGSDHPFANFLF